MKIVLNGTPKEIADGTTVLALLGELALTGPVAVELNQDICRKKDHGETILNGNDVVEVVTIVGGG